MRHDEPWHVTTHRMDSAEHGAFFANAQPNGQTTAARVWGDHPDLQHEWIGPGGSGEYTEFPDVESAKRACEARLAKLREAKEGRCACGAALAYYGGAGASGVLCPRCDVDHASELDEAAP